MKKYLLIAAAVSLAAGANTVYLNEHEKQGQIEFILQGAKPASIVSDVSKVGGKVVHEYSVIDAVSVKMSPNQLSELKKLNPLVRSFKGQEVKVSSVINTVDSQHLTFDLSEDTVVWNGVNESNAPFLINALSFNLPSANEEIEKLRINGRDISLDSESTNQRVSLAKDEQILVAAGAILRVEIEFESLASTQVDAYNISFDGTLANDSTAPVGEQAPASTNALETASELKALPGTMIVHADNNAVTWKIANRSLSPVHLTSVALNYPNQAQMLTALHVNGEAVSFAENLKNELEFTQDIALAAQQTAIVKATFNTLSTVANEDYSLSLNFSDADSAYVQVPIAPRQRGLQRDTHYPSIVRADLAHQRGITGHGVTVAVLDTGFAELTEIRQMTNGETRDITVVDVLGGSESKGSAKRNDLNGHGTHLTSIISNSSKTIDSNGDLTGGYNGVAPDVNLVVVRAFDEQGFSSYTTILNALEYVITHKDLHNIKVLNLSFSAIPSSYYWNDPLNQALMRAWDAGITVVAAAGNRGPGPMTIGVPGNTPYLITVGATSDNYTPNDLNDDFVTSFSGAGPTYEGFVKPEIVAPGGRIQGLMSRQSFIREIYSVYNDENTNNDAYFELSGTSQSTAVTSGIVALMLQANPQLTPDDIKCRLIDSARLAVEENGTLAYSIFQQGAGLVDAIAAIDSTATGCSNQGLSIAKDMTGEEHFVGPTRLNETTGDFYIPGVEGLDWNGIYTDAQLWRNTAFHIDAQLWRNTAFHIDAQLWRNTAFNIDAQLWRNTAFNIDAQLWRNTAFNIDAQLWRNTAFNVDAQLWRNTAFNIDTIERKWVDHE